MNTKIYVLIEKKLKDAFSLPKYQGVFSSISKDTVVLELPWTPSRYEKFVSYIEEELSLSSEFTGTVEDIVNELDKKYMLRFFGEIWKPRTETYQYTGWNLASDITKENPKSVLDVGCGYHPFKGRIPNLIGIDPFNNCADYQVDILEYKVEKESHDHIIALGSINFNSREDIEVRFSHCVDLLMKGGKFYLRANPGIPHKNGPYVDIFPWTFEIVAELSKKYNLKLLEFKKDNNDRLYFVYQKM